MAPCRDKLHWARVMLDERLAAFRRRGVTLPPPMVVADSWLSDSKLMQYVGAQHQGTVLVEGKQSYTFILANGHKVKGGTLSTVRGGSGDSPGRQASSTCGCGRPVRRMVR